MNLVQKNFDENFAEYKKSIIALYGVGKNAERIIKNVKGYDIRCLIDEKEAGKSMWGLPILSLEEALKTSNMLIIAATPSSTKIVFNRIKDYLSGELTVFDIRGHKLTDGDFANLYWNFDFEKLCEEIDKNKVVTFDIFDTLLMRKVYEPRDIFFIIERYLKENGWEFPFAEWRIQAEELFACEAHEPNLDEIYRMMGKNHEILVDKLRELEQIEIKWEAKILCPRRQIVDALNYAVKNGKDVYLISDMYLSSDTIDILLKKNGINGYKKIFVSNEWNASKRSGYLYKVFMNNINNTEQILHIGDNWYSDVEIPRQIGISSFWVMNAKEMMETSSIRIIKNCIVNLDDKILVGTILSILFNSPFALNYGNGKVYFNKLSNIACTSLVGIAMGFISWIIDNVRCKKNAVILFTSRDCYFFYELYLCIQRNEPSLNLPAATYFYVSRQALRSSEITSYEEIEPFFWRIRKTYGKTKLKHLMVLIFDTDFGISYDGMIGDLTDEEFEEFLRMNILMHSEEIILLSKEKRRNYLRYLKMTGVLEYENIYITDVQTTGNSLKSLEKLFDKKIELLTIRLIYNYNNISLLKKSVFFKDISPISSFANKCSLLEEVYASSGGQLKSFDKYGYPSFYEDTKYDNELLRELQVTMREFVDSYIDNKWYFRKLSINLLLKLFDLIDSTYSLMDESIIDKFASNEHIYNDFNMNIMKNIRGISS